MTILIALTDILLTLLCLPLGLAFLAMNRWLSPKKDTGTRNILVFDMAYTLGLIKRRKLEVMVTCQDLRGYFSKVFYCHPFGSLVEPDRGVVFGPPESTPITEKHMVIEGRIGLSESLARLQVFNLFLCQVLLVAKLDRLVRQSGVTVIRSGDPYYLGLFGLLLARTNGIPLAMRLGAHYDRIRKITGKPILPRLLRKQWIEVAIQRFVIPKVDLIAGATADYIDFAVDNGASRSKTTVFPYGTSIHPLHFALPEERPPSDLSEFPDLTERFMVSVTRLEPTKKPEHLVKVLSIIRKNGGAFSLVIVGEGSMRHEMQKLSEELGVSDSLILAGDRSQEWLATTLPKAAVMLAPLAGRALTESSLAEVPAVAYDVDWHKDVIITGETGELVPLDDIEAMAAAAQKLLEQPEYARTIGRNLRHKVSELMNLDQLIDNERSSYQRLFGNFYPNRKFNPAMENL